MCVCTLRSKLYAEGEAAARPAAEAPEAVDQNEAPGGNNYSRPGGQNVGNFLTEAQLQPRAGRARWHLADSVWQRPARCQGARSYHHKHRTIP